MRIAVLVLVLANLAVLAWSHWAQGPAQAADLVPLTQTRKATLVLLHPAPAETGAPAGVPLPLETGAPAGTRLAPAIASAPAISEAASLVSAAGVASAPPPIPVNAADRTVSAPASSTVTRPAAAPAQTCLVWAVSSRTAAGSLAARLRESGLAARVLERLVPARDEYRVLLAGFPGTAAVERAEADLRRSGMRDLYLLPATGTRGPALSVGVFDARVHAEHRAARVRGLGFKPQIRTIRPAHTQLYLEAKLPPATSVAAALRESGVARAPRRIVCTAPAPAPATVRLPAARSAR